jgi:2-oxoglutarate dehydrogenase complex dehydrogenase (E1) component-like enzyme
MYAHSLEGKGPESWQRLEDHLRRVADKAGDFAGPFGAAKWARCAMKSPTCFSDRYGGIDISIWI